MDAFTIRNREKGWEKKKSWFPRRSLWRIGDHCQRALNMLGLTRDEVMSPRDRSKCRRVVTYVSPACLSRCDKLYNMTCIIRTMRIHANSYAKLCSGDTYPRCNTLIFNLRSTTRSRAEILFCSPERCHNGEYKMKTCYNIYFTYLLLVNIYICCWLINDYIEKFINIFRHHFFFTISVVFHRFRTWQKIYMCDLENNFWNHNLETKGNSRLYVQPQIFQCPK